MLRWLYFTLATLSLAYGLAGWASHFLLPARTLYAVVCAAGIPAGIIATLIPWGRYVTRPLLFAVWPIGCTAFFFSALGTFDFSKAAYVDLLNYEFAFIWGGAAYAVIVFWPRKKKVFDEAARKHSGWQARASEASDSPHYFRNAMPVAPVAPGEPRLTTGGEIEPEEISRGVEKQRFGNEKEREGIERDIKPDTRPLEDEFAFADALIPEVEGGGWISLEEAMREATGETGEE